MDALLLPFLAAALAGIGAATQMLSMLLAQRFQAQGRVLAGIAAAALAIGLTGAAAGVAIHGAVNFWAVALMTAVALLSAGAEMVLRVKPPVLARYGGAGPFWASFLGFLILGFGNAAQFLVMVLAARAGSLWVAGIGGGMGMLAAAAPAVILGAALPRMVPLAALRRGAGVLFLLAGATVAVQALQLV